MFQESNPVLAPIADTLAEAVREGVFPGAVAAVGGAVRDRLWPRFLVGAGCLGEGARFAAAVGPGTLYDLASLTKIVAATLTTMALVRDGRLRLETRVVELLPEFRGGEKERVTLEQLCAHASGLPAWSALYASARSRDEIVAAAAQTPLEAPPLSRERYSDLGAILWGECLTRATRAPLATLAWREVFEPLALRETLFRPPAHELHRIAPTEREVGGAGGMIHGVVHDENARAMGGVSAHAGLFSTAEDLACAAREILRGLRGASRFFPPELLARFSRRCGLVRGSSRALGWDTRSASGSSSGRLFSPGSFGHTGFTGTSLWIDPHRQLYAVLLSNRVHPTRENQKILALRPRFHDTVVRCWDEATRGRRRRVF